MHPFAISLHNVLNTVYLHVERGGREETEVERHVCVNVFQSSKILTLFFPVRRQKRLFRLRSEKLRRERHQ